MASKRREPPATTRHDLRPLFDDAIEQAMKAAERGNREPFLRLLDGMLDLIGDTGCREATSPQRMA